MLEVTDVFQTNWFLLLGILIWLSHLLSNQDSSKYKGLALRLHPERIAEKTVVAEDGERVSFATVAEAYDVLSDPLKRAIYDQYGEDGLKKGVRGPDGCVPPYLYHGQPLRTYREFFGTENPYADLLDNLANPPALRDCPEARGIKNKDAPVIKALPLTLNEVFYGGIKKMKIQRLVLTGDNNKETTAPTSLEEKILSIPIMPGMPSGAKIVFPEEGDQGPTKIPGDIIFVTEDKPDEVFKRDGSDLRMTIKISLCDALTGTIVAVNTIDERILRVPITSVISPDYVKTISGEGLPLPENPDRRGNLIIDFNIEFPTYISHDSKIYVQKAFQTQEQLTGQDNDNDEKEHRIFLDGKMYTRTGRISPLCSH